MDVKICERLANSWADGVRASRVYSFVKVQTLCIHVYIYIYIVGGRLGAPILNTT